MKLHALVHRNLVYFWRTHLAVFGGVAVAVGVLTGALLVGDSVRGSLRDLFLSRLGNIETVIVANNFFRDELASDIGADTAPLIAFVGMVTHETSGRRRADVQVYGVDDRFWSFHDVADRELSGRDALVTSSLRDELGSGGGDALLLRVERPSAVARGSLHGLKEDTGRTLRLTVRDEAAPEFSMYPRQDAVRAVFVPLARLQRDLGQEDKVNTILVGGDLDSAEVQARLRTTAKLSDLGVRVRVLEARGALSVESDALMLSDPIVAAARAEAAARGMASTSILTYLANTLEVGDSAVPYSLVTALDDEAYRSLLEGEQPMSPSLVLNSWAASDLGAARGDSLTMEFYVWQNEGQIETHTADFVVDGVIEMEGWGADRDVAPEFPGISETADLADWDPPFPIDLARVRDKDEDYWDEYRTTPKAFIRLARGQRLWPVQQGTLTSIRLESKQPTKDVIEIEAGLRARLNPLDMGFSVIRARVEGVAASRGATDFGEYFVYFSYFLVVAALLLTGLFFKLGVEQRLREIGTLRAIGFSVAAIRRVFWLEGATLSVAGGIAGIGIAWGYAWIVMYGLRTWWVDAVGTRLLTLHVSTASLAIGLVGGVAAASVSIAMTLRYLKKIPPRSLLSGDVGRKAPSTVRKTSHRAGVTAWVTLALGAALVAAASAGIISQVFGFFGAGNLFLVSALLFQWIWLRSRSEGAASGHFGQGSVALLRLGFRNATYRPGRSLVDIALIAFASFTIVAVDGFRKNDDAIDLERNSGSGGYPLVAESLLPLHWDPNTEQGRDAVNLPYPGDPDAVDMRIEMFRLRPGDDASCLNLYRPQNPRVLAASAAFIHESRFRFNASLASTPEEEDNPWLLLNKSFSDGAVPVIGDANSMTYVLHLGLGDDFLLPRVGETPLRLRLVATLADSIFQGELLMSEDRFLTQFPRVDGFRFLLVDTPEPEAASNLLEQRLSDLGLDVQSTSQKLAGFHRVENTYLSTFQTLGGLGLVLGTFGLAAVLLRNVLERRRELALLRAVGFRRKDFSLMIVAENSLLLLLGLVTGGVAAVVAIAPALWVRGGSFGGGSLGLLLLAVIVSGFLSSVLAVLAVSRAPLLSSLKTE